ncbi:MAG: FAD:protein FMN transferase, partial [Vicinamibacteraceae bacterium]
PSWSDTDASRALVRVEQHDEAMGATFSIVLHGKDRAALEAAANAALDEAQRLDQLLSNYRPTSEWSAMNRGAATRPVRVSDELFMLLQNCMTYSRQSEGAFDITVGPLVKLWGFFEGEGELAGRAQVINTLRRVGYRHVQLDLAAKTVAFERPGMELDPGGIGKGYAIDRMVEVLKRHRVRIALLSASGSSIYGMGSPPGEPGGWKVKIRAPRDPHASVAEVQLENMSISTSGGYEKFFWANGRAYSHIIDPRSGYPARGSAAVSVLAPRAVDSEAWTKPFFVNGRTWTAAHKPSDVRVLFCEDVPTEPCTWIQ